jgi:hypothetical protein
MMMMIRAKPGLHDFAMILDDQVEKKLIILKTNNQQKYSLLSAQNVNNKQ